MLKIESVNHIGIRVKQKERSVAFYEKLGFKFGTDAGFEKGHPIVMQHPSGVVLNLLGPANVEGGLNILMDVDEKHPGITHFALTVTSLDEAKGFMENNNIDITGSFNFGNMSAIFVRDPDRNIIELDAYSSSKKGSSKKEDIVDYSGHL